MIVVVGNPAWRDAEPHGPAGRACGIAISAAAHGAAVELVGRAGDDPAGNELMIALARVGVGHVAVLRDPARPTPLEAPDEADDGEPSFSDDEAVPRVAMPVGDLAPSLEPADVSLGLQYLTSFSVLVVTDDVPATVLPVAVDAAAYAGAHLVVLVRAAVAPPDATAGDATVLVVPDTDPDGAFAGLLGTYAAALDRGLDPAAAFATATAEGGASPLPGVTAT